MCIRDRYTLFYFYLPQGGFASICSGFSVHILNVCHSVLTHFPLPPPIPLLADQSGNQPTVSFNHQSAPILRMFLHDARSSGLPGSSKIRRASQDVYMPTILLVSTDVLPEVYK